MKNLERQQDILLGRIATLEKENARLRAQRDKLLEACKGVLAFIEDFAGCENSYTATRLREAIAAAKENK